MFSIIELYGSDSFDLNLSADSDVFFAVDVAASIAEGRRSRGIAHGEYQLFRKNPDGSRELICLV